MRTVAPPPKPMHKDVSPMILLPSPCHRRNVPTGTFPGRGKLSVGQGGGDGHGTIKPSLHDSLPIKWFSACFPTPCSPCLFGIPAVWKENGDTKRRCSTVFDPPPSICTIFL